MGLKDHPIVLLTSINSKSSQFQWTEQIESIKQTNKNNMTFVPCLRETQESGCLTVVIVNIPQCWLGFWLTEYQWLLSALLAPSPILNIYGPWAVFPPASHSCITLPFQPHTLLVSWSLSLLFLSQPHPPWPRSAYWSWSVHYFLFLMPLAALSLIFAMKTFPSTNGHVFISFTQVSLWHLACGRDPP